MKRPPTRQNKISVEAQGKRVAPLLPNPLRTFGALKGVVHVDAKFSAPLPLAELDAWEGRARKTREQTERRTQPTDGEYKRSDPLTEVYALRRRWVRQFLRRHETWSRDQVAALLRITPNAVRLRVRRGTLLAVTFEGRTYFPALQFDRRRRQVRRDVRESLAVTRELDGWVRLQALVRPLRGRQ